MKNLLDLEGPLFQYLSRVGDLIILNALFLLCCIPVVTVGASTAALNKMTQDLVHETEGGVLKGFSRLSGPISGRQPLCGSRN